MNNEKLDEIAEKLMYEILEYEIKNSKSTDVKGKVVRFTTKKINESYDNLKKEVSE